MILRYLAEGEALDAPELHVEEDKPREVEDKEQEDGAQQRLRLVHLLVPVPVHQEESHRRVRYVVFVRRIRRFSYLNFYLVSTNALLHSSTKPSRLDLDGGGGGWRDERLNLTFLLGGGGGGDKHMYVETLRGEGIHKVSLLPFNRIALSLSQPPLSQRPSLDSLQRFSHNLCDFLRRKEFAEASIFLYAVHVR
jgi:hypothetical protein